MVCRSDGLVCPGPRPDLGLWGRARSDQATNIAFGDSFIEFSSVWRLAGGLGGGVHGEHLSLSYRRSPTEEPITVAVWRSDGVIDTKAYGGRVDALGSTHIGPRSDFNDWSKPVLAYANTVVVGEDFIQLGPYFRLGDVDGTSPYV